MADKYDFSGWATRNDLLCSDGRTIRKNAFQHNDGEVVPLVWNHQHNDPFNVLGHALLENRDEGVYAYCSFNDTEAGRNTKQVVAHGDIRALSIYANKLKQNGNDVLHGDIKEVSLVHAGANPGASIQQVMCHGEISDDQGIIFTGEEICLAHSKTVVPFPTNKEENVEIEHADLTNNASDDKTVADVFNSMNEEQKTVCYALIGAAVDEANDSSTDDTTEGGNDGMKHNSFDPVDDQNKSTILQQSDVDAIFNDAKRYGSLKDAFLSHGFDELKHDGMNGSFLAHGITDIDYLFPDAKNLNTPPDFIQREMSWVQTIMSGVHHTPFSRIKSMFADITADDARAKGYIKGKQKIEEVFGLLKRSTTPTTIYKKQKLDRDDVIDIVDFDIVLWIKSEMRMMLDEEIARAILIGDGRLNSSDDKINELNIRPIWTDDDLYTIKTLITVAADATADVKAKAFIRAAVKSRKNYKGSGQPVLYTTEDILTDCLLMEDGVGRIIYDSTQKLASMLRVSNIITVPVMENKSRVVDTATHNLMGIIVNLADYNLGADKGGAVSMFEDFDIDYNAQKYLIETRCSGALIKPYSAIALEMTTTPAG